MINLDYKVVLAAGAVGLVVLYLARKQVTDAAQGAVKVAGAVGTAVNPLSHENIFYRATNAVVNAVSPDQDKTQTLGSRIYDWLH